MKQEPMPVITDEERSVEPVPYYAHERALARAERHNKRLSIILLISIVMLFASNIIWLVEWMSYDYVSTETVTVDGQNGVASYIGNDGDIYNGEDSYKTLPVSNEIRDEGNP
jgi:cell division septal protein FtsQ